MFVRKFVSGALKRILLLPEAGEFVPDLRKMEADSSLGERHRSSCLDGHKAQDNQQLHV